MIIIIVYRTSTIGAEYEMLHGCGLWWLQRVFRRHVSGCDYCFLGVFTGYSSLSWALSIPDDGKVISCDISIEYPQVGIPIWKEAGIYDKIDLKIGEAASTLR